jgi:hypothetical protein
MKNAKKNKPILEWLLADGASGAGKTVSTFAEWEKQNSGSLAKWSEPVDRAIAGGFLSNRLAYCFAYGYQAAIQRMVPAIIPGTLASFCVTEEGGAHPGAIKCNLAPVEGKGKKEAFLLSGSKKFITMAKESHILLVAASTGLDKEGKNSIRMALVEKNTTGIEIIPMKELPFVPEISHGTATFTDVVIPGNNLLPGDGYLDYIKPFRTIEDIHVMAAAAAYILGAATLHGWPREAREKLLALLVTARGLSMEDPASTAAHIALGGLFSLFAHLVDSINELWSGTDEDTRAGWERDKALLRVAGKARAIRLDKAWSQHHQVS